MGSTTGPSKFKRFINRIFGKRGQKAQQNEPVTTASRQPLSRASRDIPQTSTTAPRNQPNAQLPLENTNQNRIADTAPQLTLPNSSEALSPGLLDIHHPMPHGNHERAEIDHTASGISNVVNPRDYRSDTLSTSTTFSSPSPPDATGHSSLFPSPLFSAADTTAQEYRDAIHDDEVDTFGHQSSPVSSSYSTAPRTPPRDGGLDLTNTMDYDVETRHAPAVTHEIVIPHVHEIVEERIEREVHVHDVHHYIQPVLDIEYLPAKHYLQDESGNLMPISAQEAMHYPEIRQSDMSAEEARQYTEIRQSDTSAEEAMHYEIRQSDISAEEARLYPEYRQSDISVENIRHYPEMRQSEVMRHTQAL